jgi:chemotaxis methyl-accepting protein methylase
MTYIHTLPSAISFRGKGLFGYSFGPLKQKGIEVLYIESEKGHDTFMVCKGVTRIYYVLAGSGSFTIEGREHNIWPGVLVEVPPGLEYSYSGRMTMVAFCKRRWFPRKDRFTRWNRDVVGEDAPRSLNSDPWLTRLVRLRLLGKSPTNAFLRANRRIWKILPASLVCLRPIDWYGRYLHALACMQGVRAQAFNTHFLRNRPELELIQRLVGNRKSGDTIRVAVLGCSTGAEAYSIAWAIRTARPDLRLVMQAVDVSSEAVEFARRGVYALNATMALNGVRDCMAAGRWRVAGSGSGLVSLEIFERLTTAEKLILFDFNKDAATIKDWIREGIDWRVADVRERGILDRIGLQDIVVASNFLCHMEKPEAERCLRNIAELVDSQGYFFVSGIDIDIRQRVARELGWEPVTDFLEEIHDGDPCLRSLWPFEYAGLEPLNKRRQHWKFRYAAAFYMGSSKGSSRLRPDSTISDEAINTTR